MRSGEIYKDGQEGYERDRTPKGKTRTKVRGNHTRKVLGEKTAEVEYAQKNLSEKSMP